MTSQCAVLLMLEAHGTMPWCDRCHIFMERMAKEIAVPCGRNGEVLRGDRYLCMICGNSVIVNFR
jgi:hypothetical protein